MKEHGNRIRVDPETQKEIIRRYETESAREIAEDYPFSVQIVIRVLKEARVHLRKKNERGNRDTKTHPVWKDAERVIHLYQKQELSTYEIAEKYGCAAPTIIDILEENGISRRGRCAKWTDIGSVMTRAYRIELGQLLKKTRLDIGLSRKEMVLKLGLTDFYTSSLTTIAANMYFWEKGQFLPEAKVLLRYTERFGVDIPNLKRVPNTEFCEVAHREACEERRQQKVTEATFYLAGGQKLVVKYDENGEELDD